MFSIIQAFALIHPYWVYLLIVVAAFLEGTFLSLLCGTLVAVGYLRFFPILLAISLGDIIGDVLWYMIGYHFGQPFVVRFGRYFGIYEREISALKGLFIRHQNIIVFLSKISNGLGMAIAILFTAGLARMHFARYIAINVIGELMWTGLLVGVGYTFSDSFLQTQDTLYRESLVLSLGAIACAFLFLRHYLRIALLRDPVL